MKKIITSYLVVGLLMLPIMGNTADSDPSPAKTYVKDSVITAKVKADLAGEKFSSLIHINIDTDNQGVVTLSGSATNQDDIDKAVSITRVVKGVTAVVNKITLVVAQ